MGHLKTAEAMADRIEVRYPDLYTLGRDVTRAEYTDYAERLGCGVLWIYDDEAPAGLYAASMQTFADVREYASDHIRNLYGERLCEVSDMPNGYILLNDHLGAAEEKFTFGHEVGHFLLMLEGYDEAVEESEERVELEMAANLVATNISLARGSLSGVPSATEIFTRLDDLMETRNVTEVALLARAVRDAVMLRAIQLFDDESYKLITLGCILDGFDMRDSVLDQVAQVEVHGEYGGPYAFSLPVDRPRQLQLFCGVSKRENAEWRAYMKDAWKLIRKYRRDFRVPNVR